ncbi:hypothetical protein SAMD00019534_010890, partial [Acytostelium subglobosum LB1]|uniref:hypothetical protein n=1 Tax=Acytostelium subglobosum LB1 TaxID=1410327 RepID=UPI0006448B1B
PQTITSLTFGDKFNQPIRLGQLPSSLTHLELGYRFNSTIEQGSLPAVLRSLSFGMEFKGPLTPGSLPPSLQSLDVEQSRNIRDTIVAGSLPPSIKKLIILINMKLGIDPGSLPQSLQTLIINGTTNLVLGEGILPPSLTELSFPRIGHLTIIGANSVPSNLRWITIQNIHHIKYFEHLTQIEQVEFSEPCLISGRHLYPNVLYTTTIRCNILKITVERVNISTVKSKSRFANQEEIYHVVSKVILAAPNVGTYMVDHCNAFPNFTYYFRVIDDHNVMIVRPNFTFKFITLLELHNNKVI